MLFPSVRDAWVAFFEKGGVASALRPVGGSEGAIRYSSAMLAAPPAVLVRAVQVVWQRPSVLVALTVCLACVPFGDGGETDSLGITPADVSAAVLVGLVVLQQLRVPAQPSISVAVAVGATAVLAACFVATVTATDPSRALPGLVRLIELLIAVPIAVAMSLRSRVDLVLVGSAAVGAAVFEGGLGTYQFVTGTGAGFGGSSVRAVGTFGAYDIQSMATVVTFGLLVALAVALGTSRRALRHVAAGVSLALMLPLAMSLSRGSWLAAVAAALVVIALSGLRKALLTVAVVGLLAVVVLTVVQPDLGVLGSRAGSVSTSAASPDRSVKDRYDLWTIALDMWEDHPITGVGVKSFSLWRDSYAPMSLSSGSDISDQQAGFRRVELLSPHNLYLLIASEQGLLGITAYVWLLLALAAGAFRGLRGTAPGSVERVVGLFAVAFLVRYLVASIWGDLGGPPSVVSSMLMGVVIWFAGGARLAPAQHRPSQLSGSSVGSS